MPLGYEQPQGLIFKRKKKSRRVTGPNTPIHSSPRSRFNALRTKEDGPHDPEGYNQALRAWKKELEGEKASGRPRTRSHTRPRRRTRSHRRRRTRTHRQKRHRK